MTETAKKIDDYFGQVGYALGKIDRASMEHFLNLLAETNAKGSMIYLFGNGGSGSTASHFASDLTKDISLHVPKRFKAVCFNDNIPSLLAIANDISYDDVFVEPLKNFLTKEDLVIGISGSGNSTNVVRAFAYATNVGAKTVAICGMNGGEIKGMASLAIHVPIDDMEISEDAHLSLFHCAKRILIERLNA